MFLKIIFYIFYIPLNWPFPPCIKPHSIICKVGIQFNGWLSRSHEMGRWLNYPADKEDIMLELVITILWIITSFVRLLVWLMASPAAKQTNNIESKVLRGEWRQAPTLLPYPPSILRCSPTEWTLSSVLKYSTYLTI